ncbi:MULTISPECIES: hypothetical protein [Actinomycetes]|uniref:hypothetical protein n=1 Tax=Actinomycetes TaxID=1760 RepID=UPI0004C23BCE|nr:MULTISPECIES: hypothetical protein [Actinomycetes]
MQIDVVEQVVADHVVELPPPDGTHDRRPMSIELVVVDVGDLRQAACRVRRLQVIFASEVDTESPWQEQQGLPIRL